MQARRMALGMWLVAALVVAASNGHVEAVSVLNIRPKHEISSKCR